MNDAQARYDELETQKAALNPAYSDDAFKLKQIEGEQAELKAQLANQDKQAAQNQKFDDLKTYVEGLNLNETLGHPEAAKIVHALLYEQSQKHVDELIAKDQELAQANEQLASASSAQADLAAANEQIKQLTAENEKLTADLDEARKDARYQLNETSRLKQLLQSAEQRLDDEKKRRSDIKPSESLQQLLEGAKAVTTQRKTPITNVQPANEKGTHYTAQNADTGEQLTIPHYAMGAYEQVERLRMPDEPVTDAQFHGGGADVAGANVVPANAGDAQGAGDHAAVPEAADASEPLTLEFLDAKYRRLSSRVAELELWKKKKEMGEA